MLLYIIYFFLQSYARQKALRKKNKSLKIENVVSLRRKQDDLKTPHTI